MITNVGCMAKFSIELDLRFGLVWGGLSGRYRIRWRGVAYSLTKETGLGWWIFVLIRKFTMSRVGGIRFERFFNQVELGQVGLKIAQLVIWVLWVQPELITKQQTMYLLNAWFIRSIDYQGNKWIIGTVKTPKQVKKMNYVWNRLTYGSKGVVEMLQFFNIFHSNHSSFPQVLYLSMNLNQTSHGRNRVDLVESIPNL